MRQICRASKSMLLATLILAVCAAASVGAAFSVPGATFRAAWPAMSFIAAGATVTCPITLGGTISASTFEAVAGTEIADVTSATLGVCSGGTATILRETLPWDLRYASFGGTLPAVTSITLGLVGASLNVDPSGTLPACLARTDAAEPIRVIGMRESLAAITSVTLDETAAIDLGGSFACEVAGNAVTRGSGTLEDEGDQEEPSAGPAEAFVQDLGTRLRERNDNNQLDNVNVPGAGVTLEMVNSHPRRDAKIQSVELAAPNREKFTLGEGANACVGGTTDLQQNKGTICQIIIRKAGAAVNDESRVRIVYRQGVSVVAETFNVRAI